MSSTSNQDTWLSYQEHFDHISKLYPDRCALVDQGVSKTYHDLRLETDLLSRFLQAHQVVRNDLVVVYMSSSYEYVIACLSILKAGAAFLPIPVDLPIAQISLIFADAIPKVVLSKSKFLDKLDDLQIPNGGIIVNLDEPLQPTPTSMDNRNDRPAVVVGKVDDYAFATYTSGTTGKPKGVIQIQRALVHSYEARYQFNPYKKHERIGCNIFFMWEILRPLMVGETTIVIPDTLIAVPKKLARYLKAHEVTEVLFTPSAFQRLIRSLSVDELYEQLGGLRTIWLNGEVVTTNLVAEALDRLPSHINLLNTYSICECHDVANTDLKRLDLQSLTDHSAGICPVGYPDRGVQIRVKNEQGLHRIGKGELYIGGHGMGVGYLHLEALTKERFPIVDQQRYYATGDQAVVDENGLITIKGRLGTMVKMRGYSVYLNSIEEALRLHPQIQDVRVFLRGAHLSQHLTAFVVLKTDDLRASINEKEQSSHHLRGWLTQHLPPYMIPSKWVRVDHFPVHTISGKLDRELLLSLEHDTEHSLESLAQEPQSTWAECSLLMCRLWARALELDVEVISEDTDFYEVGGHSLSMVDLVLSVEQVFGVALEGDELYDYPRLNDYLNVALKTHPACLSSQPIDYEDLLDAEPFWHEDDLRFIWLNHKSLQSQRVVLQNASKILLTGATGYLGLGLLDTLLTHSSPHTQVICLVRGSSTEDGQRVKGETRLINLYEQAGFGDLHSSLSEGKLTVFEGDICDPYLGLEAADYDRLAKDVDLIFHCAALVNLRAIYDQTKPSIVEGSRHILNFATTERIKTLHHISTNSVLAIATDDQRVERRSAVEDARLLKDGYSQAKWVAEQLMESAAALGLPVTIYRPGNIGPHRTTTYANPHDLSHLIWQAVAQLKTAPSKTEWRFECTPIDVTAELIIKIAHLPRPKKYYHLVHPRPLTADLLFEKWNEQRMISWQADWRVWKSVLLSSSNPAHKVLATSLTYFNDLLIDDSQYSIANLRADVSMAAEYYNQSPDLNSFFDVLFNGI